MCIRDRYKVNLDEVAKLPTPALKAPGKSEIALVKRTLDKLDADTFSKIVNILVNAREIEKWELDQARQEDSESVVVDTSTEELYPPDRDLEPVTASTKKKL